jgi:hypothetical protein
MSTINLLPKQEGELLAQDENRRLVLVLGIVFLSSLISLALILFSIEIYISGQVEAQRIILAQKETESIHIEGLGEEVEWSNSTFSKLNSFYENTFSITKILEKTSLTLPPGTNLNSLTLRVFTTEEGEHLAQFSLSGFSPDRTTLLTLKKNLEDEEKFQEVYFPPHNWTKPKEINFSVNFSVSK